MVIVSANAALQQLAHMFPCCNTHAEGEVMYALIVQVMEEHLVVI